MKAVILAGGMGTRLAEETVARPKPMVEIGGRPLLWHIMKLYAAYDVQDFVICLGYKGYMIKEYFRNYTLHSSDVTLDLSNNTLRVHQNHSEPWRVTLVDTGETTQTGGRIRRVRDYLGSDDFCLTYGDGVADVNIRELIAFHKRHQCKATVTAVQPPGRFGALNLQGSMVTSFVEKPHGDGGWINGGFFVLKPAILDYIAGDDTLWEAQPLEQLAKEQQLQAFEHRGFWRPMDTLRDKQHLEMLWQEGAAPWKIW